MIPFENMGRPAGEGGLHQDQRRGRRRHHHRHPAGPVHHPRGSAELAAGANPIVMKKGMSKAVDAAVNAIRENSQKVNGSDDIARVGAVSSGDETIGKLIAEAMEKVGHDGVITIEESKTAETYSDVGGGHAVRPGLYHPLHGHRHGEDGGRGGRRLYPHHR